MKGSEPQAFEKSFREYVRQNRLINEGDKVLLGISGGIDSMVLMHLIELTGYDFAVAHCNFMLRGNESDEDEQFVRKQARYLGVPFYSKRFDTEKYALRNKVSVQVAARQLRYAFFREMCKRHGFGCCATAHHADDSIETFFINLLRGTGLTGEGGIPVRQGIFIRPLLFASRKEVESYARVNHIEWREDSSNRSDYYLRNRIRHHLIPALEETSPSFRVVIQRHIENMKGSALLYEEYIESLKKLLVKSDKNLVQIDKNALLNHPAGFTLTFELLRSYGFNRDTCSAIFRSLDKSPGKKFFSAVHELITDRQYIMVKPAKSKPQNEYLIDKDWHHFEWEGGSLAFRKIVLTHDLREKIINGGFADMNLVWVDADKLTFPLVLRKWKKGDEFHPLGMKGRKKLSDFFTDLKFSAARKEQTWILESGERICWIVGHRQDHYFRILPETTVGYEIVFDPS